MDRNDEFRHRDWDNAPLSGRDDEPWRGERRPQGEQPAPLIETLRGPLLQAGLWSSGCLLLASTVPAVLVAPLLHQLLLISGFLVSMVGLLRGESLTLQAFNRQDAALLLLALGTIAALFIDPAAVQAYIDANNLGAAAGATVAN
jgi:hypothetical protein